MKKGTLMIFILLMFVGCSQQQKVRVVSTLAVGAQVNLNTATKAEIVKELHGVGPKTADKIIAARESKPFNSKYDLLERKVIGKDLFSSIEEDITVYDAECKHCNGSNAGS